MISCYFASEERAWYDPRQGRSLGHTIDACDRGGQAAYRCEFGTRT